MGLRTAIAAVIFLLGVSVGVGLRGSAGAAQTTGVLTPNLQGVIYVDGTKYAKTDAGIQAALDAAKAGTVVLAPGVYQLNQAIRMTTSGQQLLCSWSGSTTLSYVGTADIPAIIDVGTSAEGRPNLNNISVSGCTVSGNAHVMDAIRTRGVHHSDFSNNSLINVTEAGIHTFFAVGLKLDNLRTSVNEGKFTLKPASCIILDGPDAGHETTIATITSPICEGVSGDGIKFGYASQDKVILGTSEGNSTGINVTSEASVISIEGTDMEVNKTDVIVGGAQTVLSGVLATTQVHVLGTSHGTRLSGGLYNSITIDAKALNTHLELLTYNVSGMGHILDEGTATSRFAVSNANGSAYNGNVYATGEALPLSTKSSPYTLTVNDSWVNVTGNTPITVPHAERGRLWTVFNAGSGTVTLRCDTGSINGTSSITLSPTTGKDVTADGANCWAK